VRHEIKCTSSVPKYKQKLVNKS